MLERKIQNVNESDKIPLYIQYKEEETDQYPYIILQRANLESVSDIELEIVKFYDVEISAI